MPILRDLFLTKKVYFVIFAIFIILVLSVTLLYKYGIVPDFLSLNSTKLIKIVPAEYVDSKYNIKLVYPGNKFTFKEQAANFYIYDEIKKETNLVDVAKNTPFNIAMTPVSENPQQ